MLAKNVNDNAGNLDARGVCECFASKLAPTGGITIIGSVHMITDSPRFKPFTAGSLLLLSVAAQAQYTETGQPGNPASWRSAEY